DTTDRTQGVGLLGPRGEVQATCPWSLGKALGSCRKNSQGRSPSGSAQGQTVSLGRLCPRPELAASSGSAQGLRSSRGRGGLGSLHSRPPRPCPSQPSGKNRLGRAHSSPRVQGPPAQVKGTATLVVIR
ncbi:hypothetical protein H1C71_018068, partial [Ictidomys tridecemlineatus]